MAKKKKKNPYKSWSRMKNEDWFSYLRRILTYNRLQVIIAFLALLLAFITFYLTFIYQSEEIVLKENIEKNINHIESKLNREKIQNDPDTSEYVKLLHNYQLDVLDYIVLYKSVSESNLSENYADLPISEVIPILLNEYERRHQLYDFAQNIFEDISIICRYELLTDTLYRSKLSEEKQSLIKKQLQIVFDNDSIKKESIVNYLTQAKIDLKTNSNNRKNLKKAISEMKATTNYLEWYKLHNNMIDFAIESNNLFEISKRKYKDIKPYNLFEELINNKLEGNDSIHKDSIRNLLIREINKKDIN